MLQSTPYICQQVLIMVLIMPWPATKNKILDAKYENTFIHT
jgi:hypothetical protein